VGKGGRKSHPPTGRIPCEFDLDGGSPGKKREAKKVKNMRWGKKAWEKSRSDTKNGKKPRGKKFTPMKEAAHKSSF